ncbi:DASH complex subunit DAD3 [Cladophialophora carrionii]|uniref:DASH complex subunit DAD3 n=1 Tax=Cladophialophora carrionii TaxID=86049 RepID=A0A1C1C8K7_9EURO|nr:DASH complex subunit DAD3 [Cladophialophora carrionii]
MDDSTMYNNTQNSILNLAGQSSSGVSPLEQEVLDEYEKLANNMKELSSTLADLSNGPITLEIAEGLRLLERKVASVYTLMKASVYSIVLQQGQMEGAEEGGLDGNDHGGPDHGQG